MPDAGAVARGSVPNAERGIVHNEVPHTPLPASTLGFLDVDTRIYFLLCYRGEEAFGLFQKSPGAFRQYHEGYEEQTAKWPQVPLDAVINWLKTQPTDMVVADFGCGESPQICKPSLNHCHSLHNTCWFPGEAKLAASVPNQVVSLDLVAAHPDVIACNMAHTPLESTSVGCVVFCLSLMGVDYSAFITEAHRVINVK